MKRVVRICSIGLLAVLAVAGTACGASGGSDPAPGPEPATTTRPANPLDPRRDRDQVVWQEFTGGGFAPAEFASGEVPDVTIYGDGRIFVQVADPNGRPGAPVLLDQAKVPARTLDAFLADAAGSGLFELGTDFGQPGVTDQPSTAVTLHTDGLPQQIDVYALAFESSDVGGPSQVTQEQQARRTELKGLLAQARALAADATPYVPEQVRATMFEPSTVGDQPDTAAAWPGPAFEAFPAATDSGVPSCLVIEGFGAKAVYLAAQLNPGTAWELDGRIRTIVVAPLVPGQEGCPPS